MKLGWLIGVIVILAVLGGAAYYFLSNSMAMTLVFTQDKQNTVNTLNNAQKKIYDGGSYDLTITDQFTDNGVTTQNWTLNLQTGRAGGADVMYAKLTDNSGTTTVYYDGSNVYKMFVPLGTGIAVYNPSISGQTLQQAFDAIGVTEITGANTDLYSFYEELIQPNSVGALAFMPLTVDDIYNTAAGLSCSCGAAFIWNPIIIGLAITVKDGSNAAAVATNVYNINLEGAMKQQKIKLGTSSQYAGTNVSYNGIGGVSVTQLSAYSAAQWGV